MKPIIVLVCLFAAASVLPVQAQEKGSRMYKCIDTAGNVYYSDKMNPDCNQGSELNRQGVVMKKKDIPKAAPTSKPESVATTLKHAEDQERRDRALMATYTSEEEIDAARDRSLAVPAQGIKLIESKLEKANRQLMELKNQADALAAQKKPLPTPLLEEVSVNQKIISGLEADLVQRKAQSDSIRAKFDADRLRFRQLSGISQASR